jgi:transposase
LKQPPSRDFKASAGKTRTKSKKKGAKFGHEKQDRPLVDNPAQVIEVYIVSCENCHHNLMEQVPIQVVRRQVTELPEIKPVVIETRQYEVVCPCCGKRQQGKLPEGLEAPGGTLGHDWKPWSSTYTMNTIWAINDFARFSTKYWV